MSERCVGIVVEGDTVWIVDASIPDDPEDAIEIVADNRWDLQEGDRPTAFEIITRRCAKYMKENNVTRAFIKATTAPLGRAKVAPLLKSAELRGAIIAACATHAKVKLVPKTQISRTYGDRSFDEFCKDDVFWQSMTKGKSLRKTSRPAAMTLIAGRD